MWKFMNEIFFMYGILEDFFRVVNVMENRTRIGMKFIDRL
jgi:hypothetical protein